MVVARAEQLRVPIAVNLNARWVPTFAKLREMVRSGRAGRPIAVSVVNRGWNPKDGQAWRSHQPRLIVFEMAIHHLDLVIWCFGMPDRVYAQTAAVPGLGVAGENVAHLSLSYDTGLVVSVTEDWACRDAAAAAYHPTHEQIVVTGSAATLVATPHELRVTGPDRVERYTSAAPWFPDAFTGPPAELAAALAERRTPSHSARQHLDVLRVVDACYRSVETRQVLETAE